MSLPKLLRILNAVAGRVQSISASASYYTDIGATVRLDAREPDVDDLPMTLVYLGARAPRDTKGTNALGSTAICDQTVTIEGLRKLDTGEESEAVAIWMLADIQQAVEGFDAVLSSLLLQQSQGLTWQGDELFQPDIGENVVGVRVTYSIPHKRKSGDPEIN